MMADIYIDGNICKHTGFVNLVTYHNAPHHLKLVCADLITTLRLSAGRNARLNYEYYITVKVEFLPISSYIMSA